MGQAEKDAAMRGSLRALVTTMVSAIVTEPRAVFVTASARENCVVLDVRVAEVDRGAVIGKKGRMAHSLRTVVMAAAQKAGTAFVLNILEGPVQP